MSEIEYEQAKALLRSAGDEGLADLVGLWSVFTTEERESLSTHAAQLVARRLRGS